MPLSVVSRLSGGSACGCGGLDDRLVGQREIVSGRRGDGLRRAEHRHRDRVAGDGDVETVALLVHETQVVQTDGQRACAQWNDAKRDILQLPAALPLLAEIATATNGCAGVDREGCPVVDLVRNCGFDVDLGRVLAPCEQATELGRRLVEVRERLVRGHSRRPPKTERDCDGLADFSLSGCADNQPRTGGPDSWCGADERHRGQAHSD